MRRVACYALTSQLEPGEQSLVALAELQDVAEAWLRSKGLQTPSEDTATFALADGREAQAKSLRAAHQQDAVWELTLTEPIEAGRFLTRLCLAVSDQNVLLFIELRAGGDGAGVGPLQAEARWPLVLRQLLQRRKWTIGGTPIQLQSILWHGVESGKRLATVITHHERRLPVIVVSEFEGKSIDEGLPDALARDLAGLAIVASIDDAASWAITDELGREWACFNGAIRIYWPIKGAGAGAYYHPLWTRERLLESADSERAAAVRIRNQLRRRLLELSTFSFDDPPELQRIREQSSRARFEVLRSEAAKNGDQAQLAEQYFNEAARLEKDLEEEREKSLRLLEQVENLTEALRQLPTGLLGLGDDIPSEPTFSLDTVAQAVEKAEADFVDELVFGSDVSDGVSTLAASAGPPDKVYEYLKTLAEMVRQRRSAGLGKDMLVWLKEHNLKASSESETVLRSSSEMKKRKWDDGSGVRREFEKHLKPKEGTSPDQCVRIYFDYDEGVKKAMVGWVGRHP